MAERPTQTSDFSPERRHMIDHVVLETVRQGGDWGAVIEALSTIETKPGLRSSPIHRLIASGHLSNGKRLEVTEKGQSLLTDIPSEADIEIATLALHVVESRREGQRIGQQLLRSMKQTAE